MICCNVRCEAPRQRGSDGGARAGSPDRAPSGASASYYLLYTPDGKQDRALDPVWLQATVKGDKNRQLVVYCEKIWIHCDDLAHFELESGRKVGPMLAPFNLK